MANVERDPPKAETRAVRVRGAEKRAKMEREAANGQDGAKVSRIKLRKAVASQGTVLRSMRRRPGTFEWRYGRDKQVALFHAGKAFAQLCERSGATVANSADLLRGTKSGFAMGLAEGRIAAIDKMARTVGELGHDVTDRLIGCCVNGQTAPELARYHLTPEREMTAVLNSDLRTCAGALRLGACECQL